MQQAKRKHSDLSPLSIPQGPGVILSLSEKRQRLEAQKQNFLTKIQTIISQSEGKYEQARKDAHQFFQDMTEKWTDVDKTENSLYFVGLQDYTGMLHRCIMNLWNASQQDSQLWNPDILTMILFQEGQIHSDDTIPEEFVDAKKVTLAGQYFCKRILAAKETAEKDRSVDPLSNVRQVVRCGVPPTVRIVLTLHFQTFSKYMSGKPQMKSWNQKTSSTSSRWRKNKRSKQNGRLN